MRTISTILFLFASWGAITAQKTAEMTFQDEVIDLGTITYDADGSFEFIFKNTGRTPLIIQKVDLACGCTIAEWDKAPVLRKKQASIRISYDTKRIGAFQKNITVYSNAKNSPIVLTIIGNVKKN